MCNSGASTLTSHSASTSTTFHSICQKDITHAGNNTGGGCWAFPVDSEGRVPLLGHPPLHPHGRLHQGGNGVQGVLQVLSNPYYFNYCNAKFGMNNVEVPDIAHECAHF